MLAANTLLSMQLLLLDAGLLMTLYLGWRLVRQRATSAGMPSCCCAVGHDGRRSLRAGVWIRLQPMQMRGVMMNPETAVCSGSVLDVGHGNYGGTCRRGAMLLASGCRRLLP